MGMLGYWGSPSLSAAYTLGIMAQCTHGTAHRTTTCAFPLRGPSKALRDKVTHAEGPSIRCSRGGGRGWGVLVIEFSACPSTLLKGLRARVQFYHPEARTGGSHCRGWSWGRSGWCRGCGRSCDRGTHRLQHSRSNSSLDPTGECHPSRGTDSSSSRRSSHCDVGVDILVLLDHADISGYKVTRCCNSNTTSTSAPPTAAYHIERKATTATASTCADPPSHRHIGRAQHIHITNTAGLGINYANCSACSRAVHSRDRSRGHDPHRLSNNTWWDSLGNILLRDPHVRRHFLGDTR